jgi:hypothetical protein
MKFELNTARKSGKDAFNSYSCLSRHIVYVKDDVCFIELFDLGELTELANETRQENAMSRGIIIEPPIDSEDNSILEIYDDYKD